MTGTGILAAAATLISLQLPGGGNRVSTRGRTIELDGDLVLHVVTVADARLVLAFSGAVVVTSTADARSRVGTSLAGAVLLSGTVRGAPAVYRATIDRDDDDMILAIILGVPEDVIG
jgi:hypothetical protein